MPGIVDAVAYLDWLEETLARKLAEKPIGEPVALRAYLQFSTDHGLLTPTLAAAVAIAGRWLGSEKPRVYAQGSPQQGFVSVLATFPNGRTALLSSDLVRAGAAGGEAPSVTLLLIGNHGTMQFTDRPGLDGLPVDLKPPCHTEQRRIAALIERSLSEGRPV